MIKCYFCEKEADIRCDWCNYPFCIEHFRDHTNQDCAKIEKAEREKKIFWRRMFE